MLKSLFRRQPFLEEGLEEWCFEAWAWLMRNLSGGPELAATPLVLPDTEFFPPTDTEGEARGAYLFERVKDLMGMAEWDCELHAVDRRANTRVGEFWHLRSDGNVAGTFQVKNNRAVVSYGSDLIAQPRALIAVFAHELCHYRLASFGPPPPGQQILDELLTDLAVAYFGFGVFAANAAFSFQQHGDTFSQGWSSRRSGYFSERTWAFALALFLTLKGQAGAAKTVLKPNIAEMTTKAERYLERSPDLMAPLRAIS